MRIARIAFVALVAMAMASCGPTNKKGNANDAGNGSGGDGGNGLPHTLDSVTVTPYDQVLELDLNSGAAVGFTAMANYQDGTSDEITQIATWATSNAAVGTIDAHGSLAVPAFSTATAATTIITADYMGLQGKAQLTIAAYRKTGPTQDFFFVLPYMDSAGNAMKPLTFSTTVPALDVFFLMDTTGSMTGEINNLKNALTGTVIPGIAAAAATTQFGVGAMMDFPVDGFGSTNPQSDCGQGGTSPDQPLLLLQTITNDTNAVATAVNQLLIGGAPRGCGNDWPEGDVEALYQLATHQGLSSPSPTSIPATPAGFHATSMPVIVDITDAKFHNGINTTDCYGNAIPYTGAVAGVAHSTQNAYDALHAMCGKVVGVAADAGYGAACSGQQDLTGFADQTGARVPPVAWDAAPGGRPAGCAAGQCCTGNNNAGVAPEGDGMCPLVFYASSTGTGVSSGIVTGIQMLARFAGFDVTTQTAGVTTDIDNNPLPTPHTTADFIKSIVPTGFVKPTTPAGLPDPTYDASQFHNVTPGTQVNFNVQAFNDFVVQTDSAQIFKANISVLASGCTPLDNRDVIILVPPTALPIGKVAAAH